MSFVTTKVVFAADLPININAIIRQQWADDTLTLRHGLDLFSDNASMVNMAIEEQFRLNREEMENTLFASYQMNQAISIYERVYAGAYNMALFKEPISFGSMGQTEIPEYLSPWLIVLILVASVFLGYMSARIFIARKIMRTS